MRKRHLVVINWDDTTSGGHWEDEKTSMKDRAISRCHSVGWLLRRNKRDILITAMRDEKGLCNDRQTIPIGCIKSIRRLE